MPPRARLNARKSRRPWRAPEPIMMAMLTGASTITSKGEDAEVVAVEDDADERGVEGAGGEPERQAGCEGGGGRAAAPPRVGAEVRGGQVEAHDTDRREQLPPQQEGGRGAAVVRVQLVREDHAHGEDREADDRLDGDRPGEPVADRRPQQLSEGGHAGAYAAQCGCWRAGAASPGPATPPAPPPAPPGTPGSGRRSPWGSRRRRRCRRA